MNLSGETNSEFEFFSFPHSDFKKKPAFYSAKKLVKPNHFKIIFLKEPSFLKKTLQSQANKILFLIFLFVSTLFGLVILLKAADNKLAAEHLKKKYFLFGFLKPHFKPNNLNSNFSQDSEIVNFIALKKAKNLVIVILNAAPDFTKIKIIVPKSKDFKIYFPTALDKCFLSGKKHFFWISKNFSMLNSLNHPPLKETNQNNYLSTTYAGLFSPFLYFDNQLLGCTFITAGKSRFKTFEKLFYLHLNPNFLTNPPLLPKCCSCFIYSNLSTIKINPNFTPTTCNFSMILITKSSKLNYFDEESGLTGK